MPHWQAAEARLAGSVHAKFRRNDNGRTTGVTGVAGDGTSEADDMRRGAQREWSIQPPKAGRGDNRITAEGEYVTSPSWTVHAAFERADVSAPPREFARPTA